MAHVRSLEGFASCAIPRQLNHLIDALHCLLVGCQGLVNFLWDILLVDQDSLEPCDQVGPLIRQQITFLPMMSSLKITPNAWTSTFVVTLQQLFNKDNDQNHKIYSKFYRHQVNKKTEIIHVNFELTSRSIEKWPDISILVLTCTCCWTDMLHWQLLRPIASKSIGNHFIFFRYNPKLMAHAIIHPVAHEPNNQYPLLGI